jgi:glycosyltransferase involved in cell wall biosynthesis
MAEHPAQLSMTARSVSVADRFRAATGPTVLQVLPALQTGGVERGTCDMAAALMDAGWRAVVASAGGPMVRELERAGAVHVTLPLGTKNPLGIWRNAARLAGLVAEWSVDLVHARSRAPAWSAYWASRRTGVPLVTTFHGTYNNQNALKRHYNAIMTRGARVIAISDFIAEHVRVEHGCPVDRIRVIPRGVDIRSFDPEAVRPDRIVTLARSWRLADGLPVVMLPGRLTRWKGQTVLIDAMARLGRRDVQAVLVGADQGRTAYRAELEALIARYGLEGVVRIVDHCNDMPAAYMLADVVVSASTDPEAFGRVVAEAGAMGRPVIVAGHGGAREIVLDGETGWSTPPADSSALAEALARALDMPLAARQVLAATAIAHVRARYTKAAMCAATLAVYAELLDATQPGPGAEPDP